MGGWCGGCRLDMLLRRRAAQHQLLGQGWLGACLLLHLAEGADSATAHMRTEDRKSLSGGNVRLALTVPPGVRPGGRTPRLLRSLNGRAARSDTIAGSCAGLLVRGRSAGLQTTCEHREFLIFGRVSQRRSACLNPVLDEV